MKISEDLYTYIELKDILIHSGWLCDENNLSDYSLSFEPILNELGFRGSIRQFVDSLPFQGEEIDLINFLNTMVNLGYRVKRDSTNLSEFDSRFVPCLFFPPEENEITGQKRPWVITGVNEKDEIKIYFPEIKKESFYPKEKLDITGTTYFFREIKEFDVDTEIITKNIPSTPAAWFRGILFRFKKLFLQVILCNTISNIFALGSPLFVMYTYDRIIGSRAIDALLPIVLGVLIAFSLDVGLKIVKGRLFSWFAVRIDDIVGQAIFERLLLLPPRYTETASVSSQLTRTRDFDSIRDFFAGNVGISLFEIPFTIIYIIALYILGGILVFVPFLLAAIYAVLTFIINNKVENNLEINAKSTSLKNTLLVETVTRLKSIRTIGAGALWFQRFRMLSGSASYNSYEQASLSGILEGFSYGFSIFAGLLTLIVGINLVWAGNLTPGALIASMMIIWKIIGPFQTVCVSLSRIRSVLKSIVQVHKFLTLKTEVSPSSFKAADLEINGSIEFNQVGLRYTNDSNPVLSGFSIKVNKGEFIGITGQNGTGKSSILKLITGLYSPQAGAVKIDGVDLRQINPVNLRRSISYIPQIPNIFSGTIAQNIRLADPTASEDKINHILNKLEVLEEFKETEDGIHHYISNPASFPFIHSYLISTARAFIRDTPILLIDEIPPRILNSERGHRFMEFILSSVGDKTIFLVNNREEYLIKTDKIIYLLGNGQAAFAKPEEILKIAL